MNTIKLMRQYLRDENRKYGATLRELPRSEMSDEARIAARRHPDKAPLRVWRSRDFLVQLYRDGNGHDRLSCTRCELNSDGGYKDGMTWDELMRLKREAGFAHRWAVECYPPDAKIINVANHRHLFLLPEKPAFAW